MRRTIDLNCDLGEGAAGDGELMPLVSSANIACGAHAGSVEAMVAAVKLARRHRVAVGAHPGHFDPEHFGRVERPVTPHEAGRLVLIQLEQMFEIAGASLRHVKLHGALYHQVAYDVYLAEAVVGDLARLWPGLVLFAPAGSPLARLAKARGLSVAEEVFADRTYQPDGTLTPRSRPDALVHDEAAAVAQVLGMIREGVVRATDGAVVRVRADTVCLHGDNPEAVAFARRLKAELEREGIAIKPVRRHGGAG